MTLLLAALLPVLSAGPADADAVKLPVPKVEYRTNEASASTSPWIDANGWQILRAPARRYYYDVPAASVALAAAEAFMYAAKADIHTETAGTPIFDRMLKFLREIPERGDLPAMANILANIGVIDDGSHETGELMNLLSRRNLLYSIVTAPDPRLDLNIRLGSKEYPKSEAANPSKLAQRIRSELTDEKRLLRVYGSEVVIARLVGTGDRVRIHLLNYANRPVSGLRVRVLGNYTSWQVAAFDKPDLKLEDFASSDGATEFTVPQMSTYVVIDLSKPSSAR
jgi:hypothetical protein